MPEPDVTEVEVDQRKWDQSGDSARCEFSSDEEILTEEDALRKGKVDPLVWRVKKMRLGASQVSMKIRQQNGVDAKGRPRYVHIPIKKSNWTISLELERIRQEHRVQALDLLYERLRETGRKPEKRKPANPIDRGDHVCVMSLYDAHFGNYVWHEECYANSDLSEAEEVYANAVVDLMDRVRGYRVCRWMMPVGNDFMHFDNLVNTTTGGTPQDCDSRYPKVLAAAETAVIEAVHEMLKVAPVDLVFVPGNHDRQSTCALQRILLNHFLKNPDVRVETQPRLRKYYRYGTNLIGLTHGSDERVDDLVKHMPLEVPPEVWAATTCREIHTGHLHTSKGSRIVDHDEVNGTRIWRMPSLAATNAWHYKKGYVGSRRAARALVYERESEFTGFFEVAARSRSNIKNRCTVDILGG